MKINQFQLILFLTSSSHLIAQTGPGSFTTLSANDTFSLKRAANPLAELFFNPDGLFVIKGTYNNSPTLATAGTSIVEGAGTRLLWHPRKAAFRVGYVSSSQWDDSNIGIYSTALGNSSIASGSNALSFGNFTTASGSSSIAFGSSSNASAANSIAGGANTSASGQYSLAFGYQSSATAHHAVALGYDTKAVSNYSFVSGLCNIGIFGSFLEIGNGGYQPTAFGPNGPTSFGWVRSNAATIMASGETILTNKAWKQRAVNASPITSGGNALVIEGHTVLNGKVTIAVAQGDISMGAYE